MLKTWLESKSIDFTNYTIDKNPIAAQYMVSLSGQRGVPYTTIEYEDGKVEQILGFDKPKLEAALSVT